MTATTPRALTEVGPGVHVATAPTYTTTSTVVVADDGTCVVVDPALTRAEVDGLALAVVERGWRTVGGFSTHPHWDHVLWAPALGDRPRWATPTTAAVALRERDELVGAAPAGHDVGLLGHLTAFDGPRLPWDARDVVVVEHGAHAPGSAALVVPDAQVMIAGDMLSDVEIPLLDRDSSDPLGEYARALDVLEHAAREHDVEVLVPGHGHVTDRAGLRARLAADRAYLDALVARRAPDDPRLAEPWLRAEHERQTAALER